MEPKIHKNIHFHLLLTRDFNFNEKSNTPEINILEFSFFKRVRKNCIFEPCINGKKILEQCGMGRTLDL